MSSSQSSVDTVGTTPLDSSSSRSSLRSEELEKGNPASINTDPSVIVGMAFRLPGARNVSQLWENLARKKDLQKKIPSDRFNVDAFHHPLGVNKGTTNARYGYFLDESLTEFDNDFFHISPKEADAMDPQQRLLLEVVYEALENAGIPMEKIRGTRTSVHVGSFSNDYNLMATKDLAQYPKYLVTGTGNAILSNRISYVFDLHGPSLTIDTACSSSLVCFHLGNQSLQSNESDIAIVAGSALHFDPHIFVTMTDFGMLSSDGRCRTFDADGSGYVRGEGVAAIILKRCSSAVAAGDKIRAVVRGSGTNHDGTKSGLMLPNGDAQAKLIRDTYKAAGIDVNDTTYFEAHGTGTPAGDPIEGKAIGSVFADSRDEPLLVGSIKSNVGHLEGASGLAGVIKATMSIESAKIFPNMHFNKPNPKIDFKRLKLEVPTELRDWNTKNDLRRASVNSFGYGGTNAHIILENYRQKTDTVLVRKDIPEAAVKRPYLVPLTSHNDKAAKNLVDGLLTYLQDCSTLNPAVFAHSLSVRRSMHPLRSFAIGHDLNSLYKSLWELSPVAKWNWSSKAGVRVGFVFTGQGAQWYAMGRQLLDQSSLFRQTIERCDAVLKSLPDGPDWSCVSELYKSAEESRVEQSLISQPLCAAVQLALVKVLRAWGITPTAVVGHSSGEIAAAYAAGVLSFESAITCAYYRGLYMSAGNSGTSQKRGAMMAVGMTEAEGSAELELYKGRIALAAVNSPSSLTLSGDEDAIIELKEKLEKQKVFVRQLRVEQAFHSHHMYPLAPGFERALAGIPTFSPSRAQCRMVSSVTARDSDARIMDAAYWAANMTGVVRFSDALAGILLDDEDEQAIDVLVEIGAHPALRGPSRQVMKSLKLDNVPYVATLERSTPAFESLLATAGQLFALGFPVDLEAINSNPSSFNDGTTNRHAHNTVLDDLPSYAWDHSEHWAETRLIRENRLRSHRHTILGAPMAGAPGNHPRWRSYLRLSEVPWLAQHVVDGKILFPAAGYISMALEAIATVVSGGVQRFQLRDVMFKNALVLSNADEGTEVILDLQPLATSAKSVSSTWYRFSICSFDAAGQTLENCHGQISTVGGSPQPIEQLADDKSLTSLRKRSTRREPSDQYYAHLRHRGLDYGECFSLLSGNIESGEGYAAAQLGFDPSKVITTEYDECIVHPTVLDAAFQVIFAAMETRSGKKLHEAFVPTFIHSASISGEFAKQKTNGAFQSFWAKSKTTMPGPRISINQVSIQGSESNDCLLKLSGLELTGIGSADEEQKRDLFFRLRWQPLFSRLASATPAPLVPDLATLVDIFAHEKPDAAVLHLASKPATVMEALQYAGGATEPRRIRSITPFSFQNPDMEWSDIQKGWASIATITQPQPGLYDLVLVSEPLRPEITAFVKPGGILVTEETADTTIITGMKTMFSIGQYTCWTNASAEEQQSSEDISIIVPRSPSEFTRSVASAIVKAYAGEAVIVPFGEPVSSTSVVSLVSLDHEVLFDEATSLHAMQQFIKGPATNTVWMLRGATVDTPTPSQATIIGLMRTLRSENDDVRLATLDLGLEVKAEHAAARALEALTQCMDEEELTERDGVLMVQRIERDGTLNAKLPVAANRQPQMQPLRGDGRHLALTIGKTGLLDTLWFEDDADMANIPLGADEIEIEVWASALNFRDIAASIGIIDDYRLGDEAAGIVVAVGSNVDKSQFAVGDRIMALRPGQGAHRSRIRNPALACHRIDDMDFVTAGSFAAVVVTAYYALDTVGRLQKGEYCLIHSAAGGVGQMAIQFAQRAGAHVIATVGSAEKRAFLVKEFGLSEDMILSSRDASFVQGVMAITGGRGCDVALNSLAGELLHATWNCLAPFGRLVEIGKRDIHEASMLSMAPFRRNVTYASVDLITMYECNRPLLAKLLHESYLFIREGTIRPPGPVRLFGYGEAQAAFRTLQIGKFFGKIVLVPRPEELVPTLPPSYTQRKLFDADCTYLLVGGLGGIGRALAEWAFKRGARHLAFFSRSGNKSASARETTAWLADKGVTVRVFEGSVTDEAAIRRCTEALTTPNGPRLAGVFQAAMLLRDVPFAQMTTEDWSTCVLPKTVGTRNLHEATKTLDLDFFVCFSSSSAVVGAVGQANYAAANAYLDALMRHRREQGLAGTSMNVGVVKGVGVVAEDAALAHILERLGYDAITEEELFYQIEEAVVSSRPGSNSNARRVDAHQLVTGVNTQSKSVYWAAKPLFRNLYSNLDLGDGANRAQSVQNVMADLRAAPDAEQRVTVLALAFIQKVTSVLGINPDAVQAKNPLSSYGLDSIVAVELRKWFSKTVGVDIALFDVIGAPSIEALVRKVSDMVQLDAGAGQTKDTTTPADRALLAKRKGTAPGVQSLAFPDVTLPAQVPLSAYQARLWFLHNLLPDASLLNFVVTGRLKGQPRLDLMKKALQEIVYRNDILRTRYFEGDEFTEQQVMDSYNAEILYEELDATADPHAAFEATVRDTQSRPMDVEEGEVIKVKLCKLSHDTYMMAFIFHHICMDNGSNKSLMDQFLALYDALGADVRGIVSIPSPKVTYSKFSVWHNSLLNSPESLDHLSWWQKTLDGAVSPSALLPFAKNHRRTDRSGERQTVQDTLPISLIKRMKRVAAQAGATPFHFVLAAFRAFVHRYTGEDDLTILMIDGNRPHPELADVLGFFVNMIPLRLEGHCSSTFEHLLHHARGVALDAMAHSSTPFDRIVNAVGAPRVSSHFPIGQIAVNYQIYGKPPTYSFSDFDLEDVKVEDIPTPCDLSLEVLEDPSTGLGMKLQYDSSLYEKDEIERFLQNFVEFMTSVIKDHRQPIDEVQMCGPKEMAHLRHKCWNIEPTPNHWKDRSVLSRVIMFAELQPTAVAIETPGGETITYHDLVDRAFTIARRLREAGAVTGDIIGIMLQPSIDMIATMLGVGLARCGYVSLDPEFATQRLHHMVSETSATVVVTSPDLHARVSHLGQTSITAIILSENLPTPDSWLYDDMTPNDPFYVIYTSGSSGKPKGVVLTHGNTQAMLSSHNAFHKLSPRDRVLFQSSPSFDISVAQIWGALTSGATVLAADRDARMDPSRLANFMHQGRVTVTYFPTTQFTLLMEHNIDALAKCSEYRSAIFAGEILPVRLVRSIYNLGTPVTVYNQFGPSEATVQTTSHKARRPDALDVSVPIGYSLPNNSHYILDNRLQPVPASCTGELFLGGAQIAQGYIGQLDATARSFIPDPFASERFVAKGWKTMYRTGDRSRFLPDGQLDFLGRISGDRQIKLRGYRIDLAEVENEIHAAAKQRLTQVRLSHVVVLPRGQEAAGDHFTDDRQLVAFIVLNKTCSLAKQQEISTTLHSIISMHLNNYMLPSGYQFMETLPKLPSGKIGRQHLLSMELNLIYPTQEGLKGSSSEANSTGGSKADEILDFVTSSFKVVLKLAPKQVVGPTQSFFDLGGQSLLFLRLQSVLRRQFNVKVELKSLFSNPTPLGITALVGAALGLEVPVPQQVDIDWKTEATLSHDSIYQPMASASLLPRSEMTDILLTGAETPSGIRMLLELLSAKSNTNITVLGIHTPLEIGTLHSLITSLGRTIPNDIFSRVRVLSNSSLASPNLGLKNQAFESLGQRLHTIYHFGNSISLLKPYSDLRRINVDTVRDLIRLAALNPNHRTEIHYLSTWSVPHLQSWASTTRSQPGEVVKLEAAPDHFFPGRHEKFAYFQSRWVAEMLLTEAAKRGIPTSIYRGAALGDASADVTFADNFTTALVRAVVRSGEIPDFGPHVIDVDVIPADYLIRVVARLAGSDAARNQGQPGPAVFHIKNPHPAPLDQVARRLGGQELKAFGVGDWLYRRGEDKHGFDQVTAEVIKGYFEAGHRMFSLDDGVTRGVLERLGWDKSEERELEGYMERLFG